MDLHPDYQVLARATVAFPVANYPAAAALRGINRAIAPIVNAAGDTTLTLDREIPADADIFVRIMGGIAASGLRAAGAVRATSTTIRVTTGQEGAAGIASALADMTFTFVVFGCPTVMPL